MKIQNKVIIFLLAIIFLISCNNQQTELEFIKNRCQFYDSIGHQFFEGYTVRNIRGNNNSSYEVNCMDNYSDQAIIRNSNPPVIEKNFEENDSISIKFAKHFFDLKCNYLYNDSTFIKLRFNKKGKIYVIFKGNTSNTMLLNEIKNRNVEKLISDWTYIII